MNKPLSKSEFIKKLNTDIQFNKKYGRVPKKNGDMVLPPCHYGFEIHTRPLSTQERLGVLEEKGKSVDDGFDISKFDEFLDSHNIPTRGITLIWNQRSADFPLGVPFNITSYGTLLCMIADEVNMVPDELIGRFGNSHIYENQIEGVLEQLTREPRKLPKLYVRDGMYSSIHFKSDFQLVNYDPHPTIKFPLSN